MPQLEDPGSTAPSLSVAQCRAGFLAAALPCGGEGLPDTGAGAAGLDGPLKSPGHVEAHSRAGTGIRGRSTHSRGPSPQLVPEVLEPRSPRQMWLS